MAKESLAEFQRMMAKEIAAAEVVATAAILEDPDKTEASVKAAMRAYQLTIRKLVNRFFDLPDDSGFPPQGDE